MRRPQFSLRTLLSVVAAMGAGCWVCSWLMWLTLENAMYVACICCVGAASVLAVIGWKM